jgi:hypothetical protein
MEIDLDQAGEEEMILSSAKLVHRTTQASCRADCKQIVTPTELNELKLI